MIKLPIFHSLFSTRSPKQLYGLIAFTVYLLVLCGCSTPTLVEVARRRQVHTRPENSALVRTANVKNNLNVVYQLTDLDVLNFTDEVKRKLANRSNGHMIARFGSATGQTTLAALAGSAKTFGWGVGTASTLGTAATYIFGLGQIIDSKGQAQAYEQAFTGIQAAEAAYYRRQLKMEFTTVNGRTIINPTSGVDRADIPSGQFLTPDGETLYYRVSKILKVLNDTLASRIPELQDLKEAHGETGSSTTTVVEDVRPKANQGAPESSGQPIRETNRIPLQLQPRNERLRLAFDELKTEDDVKPHLLGAVPPAGTSGKELLARLVLAKADLPQNKSTSLLSLSFYRQNAVDEVSTAKLETAYRFFKLLPPASN